MLTFLSMVAINNLKSKLILLIRKSKGLKLDQIHHKIRRKESII